MAHDPEFDAFCRREWPRLVGALDLYCGSLGVAEELAQEALVRAYQRWARVRTLESAGGWVHHVAMNLARSWWRRRRIELRVSRDRCSSEISGPEPEVAMALRESLRTLPPRLREVVVFRYYLDLAPAEVANLMGTTPGNIRTLTHRALAQLRVRVGDVSDWAELAEMESPR